MTKVVPSRGLYAQDLGSIPGWGGVLMQGRDLGGMQGVILLQSHLSTSAERDLGR